MAQLLVLANSWKPEGRCLAGVTADGTWLRPVPYQHGGAVPIDRVRGGGRILMPGDLIEIDLGDEVPLFYQGENVLLRPTPIQLAPPLSATELQRWLALAAANPAPFVASPRSEFYDQEYANGLGSESLALVRTDNLSIVQRTNWRGVVRPRAIFMAVSGGWDIPYTGDEWDGFPPRNSGARAEFGPAYVTVSVGDVIPDTTRHSVLAAGALAASP